MVFKLPIEDVQVVDQYKISVWREESKPQAQKCQFALWCRSSWKAEKQAESRKSCQHKCKGKKMLWDGLFGERSEDSEQRQQKRATFGNVAFYFSVPSFLFFFVYLFFCIAPSNKHWILLLFESHVLASKKRRESFLGTMLMSSRYRLQKRATDIICM